MKRPLMLEFAPRVIRLKDAARYLGMDKNRFNAEVRPFVTEVRIGTQGVGFDRLDLDAFWEEYKRCNGRPGKRKEGLPPWRERKYPASSSGMASGTSTRDLQVREFEKVAEQLISQKRKNT